MGVMSPATAVGSSVLFFNIKMFQAPSTSSLPLVFTETRLASLKWGNGIMHWTCCGGAAVVDFAVDVLERCAWFILLRDTIALRIQKGDSLVSYSCKTRSFVGW